MPIYTYRCTECGVQFEKYQTFSEDPLVKCPECGKKSLRKVFTPAGIIFKGSGWYATDHRSPSGQTSTPQKQAGDSAPESPSSSAPKPAADKPPAADVKKSDDK